MLAARCRYSLLPLAIALLMAVVVPSVAQERAGRPNIIIIMSDDMGYSDLGCYGGEIFTPQLDQLAAGGLRFTQFYNTARCCPTRAALLTGLYPHQAGIGHMMEDKGLDGYRGDLNRNCVTIAEALKPSGYATYALGKWHVTKAARPEGPKDNWPLHRGFDRYYGTITGAGSFYDPGTLVRDDTMVSPFADPEYQPPKYYYTDAISDHAVRFIAEHRQKRGDQPFFMYVAFTAAHWPMHALREDIAKYQGRYDSGYQSVRETRLTRLKEMGLLDASTQLSPTAGDWERVTRKPWEARCMEVYAAMIDRMDQGVGRIVGQLKADNQFENTLIMFLQDNGGCAETIGRQGQGPPAQRPAQPTLEPLARDFIETQGIPKRTRDGFAMRQGPGVMPGPDDTYIAYGQGWANVSNTPFREYKHWVHEGGISTPLIAHWPAGIKRKGEFERQPGHLIDLMATCVDLAKASYPRELGGNTIQPLEGRSLTPAFTGGKIEREAIYWEHEGNRAIRVENWKLVAKGPAGGWELYDVKQDRTESNNLAASEPQRVKQMTAQWEAWAKRAKVIPWIWEPQYGSGPASQ